MCSGIAKPAEGTGATRCLVFCAPVLPATRAAKADTRARAPGFQPAAGALSPLLIETVTVLRFCPNPSIRIHGFTDLWGSGSALLRIYGNPPMRFSGFAESRRTAPSESAATHTKCHPLGENARRELAHEQARVY